MERQGTRIALAVWTTLVILFLWIPLALIAVYAFNKSNVQSWPIPAFTTHWFHAAWTSEVRTSLWLSVRVGLIADENCDFAQRLDYEVAAFAAVDARGLPIYHTNVLMSVGTRFAAVCVDCIEPDVHPVVTKVSLARQ